MKVIQARIPSTDRDLHVAFQIYHKVRLFALLPLIHVLNFFVAMPEVRYLLEAA
jgi:hypothetical protein